MRKKYFYFILLITSSILFSCKEEVKEDSNVFYTCSMDPQVMKKKPGLCPICKMELTKTEINKEEDKQSIKLSDSQIQLGNIKVTEVNNKTMGNGLSLRGTVAANNQSYDVISSRVPGRIEKLYFKNTGEKIKTGDHVYDIYSDELQASIQQYLLLKTKASTLKDNKINYEQMLDAAKNKLLVWGLNSSQIAELNDAKLNSLIPFYSNATGVVNEISISEGDYVNEGSHILNIVNYNTLWVQAEAYPNDLKFIHPGQKVKVMIEGFENDEIIGKVSFENPELEPNSKITLVRVEISNKAGEYKPGMRATVALLSQEKKSLTIPETAILYEPKMNIVYVQKDNGSFSPRMVEVGIKSQGSAEIFTGLMEGEKVVSSGAYLINSEYLLRKGNRFKTDMHESHMK